VLGSVSARQYLLVLVRLYSLLLVAAMEACTKKITLRGLSLRANCTDRETAACRRSDCQLLRMEDATWSA
jgi:hypothetical protein